MIPFASSTSDPAGARQMLIDHQNGSLFPDDPKIAAIIGYENILQPTTMPLLALLCLPILPGYTAAIIYRIQILRVLEKNSMSPKTKMAQKKLVKALTIQAVLPILMMSQASIYAWRQFQLPFAHSVPYFEEWAFLLVAMVSSMNPCITVYYVAPYREKVNGARKAAHGL
ncbi:unnamed protein product, partial [Mesorhabditis belari]|uniref:G protein-coupled receptor n=1 Tax=Mesorhabditis belari TaxID=2138241 RepID=A0AAF3FA87_9BILA